MGEICRNTASYSFLLYIHFSLEKHNMINELLAYITDSDFFSFLPSVFMWNNPDTCFSES